MSKPQDKKRQQVKLARLEIVATLYKRGYSIRKIQSEVMKRLDLKTYSIATCHSDIQSLLEEWRENRIEDMDAALQLELERIDDTVRELWEQWEAWRPFLHIRNPYATRRTAQAARLVCPGEKGHTGRYVVRLVPYRERYVG